jgi:hypothetical protein
MGGVLILAVEEGGHLSLGGQLRGVFVVIFAIGLFCGSIYLLLATDVGSRLGLLISFSSLTGFLMLLGLIWFTNLTPLNALHGPPPTWKVKEVVDDPSKAKIEAVRQIEEKGQKLDQTQLGEIKASVDTALTQQDGPFQEFSTATDYVAPEAERIGGGRKGLLGHKPLYAVMKVQEVKKVEPLPGQAPPPPEADPTKAPKYVVLVRDLGSLRLPPLLMAIAFGIIFAISLVVLHYAERAKEAEGKKGSELEPKPALA